ncbi:MAG: signal peptidase I [Porticoccaceae bacterium]
MRSIIKAVIENNKARYPTKEAFIADFKFELKRWTIIFLVFFGWWYYLGTRFTIGIDAQKLQSIPGTRFVLTDKADLTPDRGDIFAFKATFLEPIEEGQLVMKYVAALPGDHVQIKPDGTILVNGQEVTFDPELGPVNGLDLSGRFGKVPADYAHDFTVPPRRLFMLGTAKASYDSRYFGPIPTTFLVGRVHQLW